MAYFEKTRIANSAGVTINPATEETSQAIAGFNIPKHDTRTLVYTSEILTSIEYYLDSTLVATKTLSYTGGALTGVTIL
jgi:hypothetical protein